MLNYDNLIRGVDPYADGATAKALLEAIGKVYLPFDIPATELAAGTSIELVSPVGGQITGIRTVVQTAIGTGGDITVEVNTVEVVGLSVTVADSATKGSRLSDSIDTDVPTGTVVAGDRIEIQPSAAFASAGAVSGVLEITL